MPIVFTKEEIKEFLEEQGFDVSDEETLHKFIHDLKKLIKYEEMKRRRRKLGHFPDETVLDSSDGRQDQTNTTTTSGQDDEADGGGFDERSSRFQSQRSPQRSDHRRPERSPVKPSPVKSVRSPVRHQTRQSERPRSGYLPTDSTSSYTSDEPTTSKTTTVTQKPSTVTRKVPIAQPKKPGNRIVMKRVTAYQDSNGQSVLEESDIDLGPGSKRNVNRPPMRPVNLRRPTSAPVKKKTSITGFQKPVPAAPPPGKTGSRPVDKEKDECDDFDPAELFQALNELICVDDKDSEDSSCDSEEIKKISRPPPHVLRDPVALYHWYKTYNWDIFTIPGEDRHMKLRWNVRAHTVGGYHPCVEVPRHIPRSKQRAFRV